MSYQLESNNKVVLTGQPGIISDLLMLNDDNGNVVISGIKHDDPVIHGLGLKEGDELLGATICFDNLLKGEVLNILKATEPYKAGLQLHTKSESTLNQYHQYSPYTLRTDNVAVKPSAYDDLFNSKIRRYLKGSLSMQDLSDTGTGGGQFKSKTPNYKLNTYSSSSNLSEISSSECSTPQVHGEISALPIGITDAQSKGHGSQFQLPSVNASGEQINVPNIETGLKTPSVNISHKQNLDVDVNAPSMKFPKAEIDGKMRENVEITPIVSGKVKSPELDVAEPNGKGTKIIVPSLNLFNSKESVQEAPAMKADRPDIQVANINKALPKADILKPGLESPKLKRPDSNVVFPKIGVKGAKLPDVDMSSPKLQSTIVNVGTPIADIHVPELKVPEVNINHPKAGIKVIRSPDENVDLPDLDVNSSKLKGQEIHFNLPKIGVKGSKVPGVKVLPTGDINLPKLKSSELNVSIPNADIKFPQMRGVDENIDLHKTDIHVPISTDVNNPDIKVPDINIDFPKSNTQMPNFKGPDVTVDLPQADFKIPKVKSPNVDIDLSGPKLEMPNIRGPNIDLPEVDINLPKLKTPQINTDLPKVNINKPKLKSPEINVDLPTADKKYPKMQIPDVNLDIPELNGPKFNVDNPNADIKAPKLKGTYFDLNLPKLDTKASKLKGTEFNVDLPKPDINIPKLSGPEIGVDPPKADINIPKRNSPEVNVDVSKGGIKIPTIKSPDVNLEVQKPEIKPKFRMPSFNLFGNKKGFPDVDLNLKGPNVKTGALDLKGPKLDVNTPSINVSDAKLKGEISGPEANIELPDTDVKGPKMKMPNFNINTPKMKIPSFQMLGPNIQAPDVNGDASLSVPKVDLNAPQINIKGTETDISAPKFKKTSFYFPSFQMKKSNVKTPSLDIDTSAKSPELEVNAPQINVKDPPEANLNAHKSKHLSAQMPSFQMSVPKVQTPDIDASGKTPEVDINAPQINFKGPGTHVDVPKHRMPSMQLPTFSASNPKVVTPDIDVDGSLKSAHLDFNAPKVKGNVLEAQTKTPNINIEKTKLVLNAPKVDIDGPKFDIPAPDANINAPKFKIPSLTMPSFQIPAPNAHFPDADAFLKGPDVDINAPKIDATKPMLNVNSSKVKIPQFQMPSFQQSGSKIETPNMEVSGSFKTPDVDHNVPSTDVKGPEIQIKAPTFRMPFFQGPNVQTPDLKVDGSLIPPKVDLNAPQINMKETEQKISQSKLKNPSFSLSGTSINEPVMSAGGDIKNPNMTLSKSSFGNKEVKISAPSVEVKQSKFRLPTLRMFHPKGNLPDVDLGLDSANLDTSSLPKVQGSATLPNMKVSAPNVSVKALDKKMTMPKFKLPIFGKSRSEDFDVKHKAPETSLPKANLEVQSPEVDANLPSISVKPPKFETPDTDLKVRVPELETTINVPRVQAKLPKLTMENTDANMSLPAANISGPKIDIPDTKMKESGFKISKPQISSPDFSVELPSVNVKAPKIKSPNVNIIGTKLANDGLNDIAIDGPSTQVNEPKWKEPFPGQTEGTTIETAIPQVQNDLKISPPKKRYQNDTTLDIDLPSAQVNAPTSKKPFSGQTEEPGEDIKCDVPSANIDVDLSSPLKKDNLQSKFSSIFPENMFSIPDVCFDFPPTHLGKS